MTAPPAVLHPALWQDLRRYTPARVALGRAGNAVPTAAHLQFQVDHAAARDAVHAELDVAALRADLAPRAVRVVQSACPDRATYLVRPDFGRTLAPACAAALEGEPDPGSLAVLICDGLSAVAVQRHAPALLELLLPALDRPGPIVAARQGRVALGDPVGAALRARAVLVLIGERPGLSSSDGMGAYLTWDPRPGRTDADRNCVSNIRPAGLPIAQAADTLRWLIAEMTRLRLTGVGLKDEQAGHALVSAAVPRLPPLG